MILLTWIRIDQILWIRNRIHITGLIGVNSITLSAVWCYFKQPWVLSTRKK